ncbi:helix-turn-helix domain-containing protein [Xenorhabdus bovienii]|uniref:Transcriptional regulator (MrfJ protein) n=4 Tax=Xenorhabdus bovienii TaxID=40576 RepID=A0A0B6X297_XENBV|nr:helix-turn-helix transcriptional regulator [Xenorhabdus bovienii]MCG3472350.1 helix-turn-helix domain-containing protein [Xenorhabdus bovienii]MDE9444411.1 helix-turn-helix domain-containing protein [Xenorhabdus bovienii]CDG89438.1 Transcriptional regulator (MrfJ protein) [Xenorhabdus bovienii str. feltiae France]CDG92745.1 Transcriptional regulator (MrfJ protein) [Xenorhabdus bovienii str. feltiae Florida]CDG98693.1 Transcriptional regulator (MrfJ protein) [Xenorhabdus bovienii str. puntau
MEEANLLVGQRIQAKRKELSMTATALAKKIGISQQQLSRYETGKNRINIVHLVEITILLDTPISWFFEDCYKDKKEGSTVNKLTDQYIPIAETVIGKDGR